MNIIDRALANLRKTSRTAKGVSDTSSSAEKPKLAIDEGNALADKAEQNFVTALRWALGFRPQKLTPGRVRKLVTGVAARISDGLLAAGTGLWRSHKTKFRQVKPGRRMKRALKGFYRELAARMRNCMDAVATAAWIEWRFDSRIHPLADGCGRCTKVLVIWVLTQAGINELPNYPADRKVYYGQITGKLADWTAFYRTLFPSV